MRNDAPIRTYLRMKRESDLGLRVLDDQLALPEDIYYALCEKEVPLENALEFLCYVSTFPLHTATYLGFSDAHSARIRSEAAEFIEQQYGSLDSFARQLRRRDERPRERDGRDR